MRSCNIKNLIHSHFYFIANGIIKDARVAEAMKKVDRAHYCPHNSYVDSPQGIGYHATISAPHMVIMFI